MSNRRKLRRPKVKRKERVAPGKRGGWGWTPGKGWVHVTQKRET
jgi:hypothetical protein